MTLAYKLLPKQASHARAIDQTLNHVFGPGRHVRMAERLRENAQAVSDLSFVALGDDNKLLGAISYWRIQIGAQMGLLLGPLVVDTPYQGLGVGRHLMQETITMAQAKEYEYILLVGDLSYYQTSGFEVAPKTITYPAPVDPNRVLIRWLSDEAPLQGVVTGAFDRIKSCE